MMVNGGVIDTMELIVIPHTFGLQWQVMRFVVGIDKLSMEEIIKTVGMKMMVCLQMGQLVGKIIPLYDL